MTALTVEPPDPPKTVLFTFALHESGRLGEITATRLYQRGVPVMVRCYQAEDSDAQEAWLLSQVTTMLSSNQFRIAGLDSRKDILQKFIHRCFVQGVAFSWYYSDRFGPNYRYDDTKHFDIRDFLTGYGAVPDVNPWTLLGFEDQANIYYKHMILTIACVRADLVAGRISSEHHDDVLRQFYKGMQEAVADAGSKPIDALGVSAELPNYSDIRYAYSQVLQQLAARPRLIGGNHGWH